MPDDSAQLKKYKRELNQLQGERSDLIRQQREIATERSKIDQGIENMQIKIKTLKDRSRALVVSEHALLRYIERVMGVDLETLKEEILSADVMQKISALRGCDGVYPNKNGFKIRIKDRTVVTILTRGG